MKNTLGDRCMKREEGDKMIIGVLISDAKTPFSYIIYLATKLDDAISLSHMTYL